MLNQSENKFVHHSECKCLSWKPIIAGAVAAIGFTFLLNLFSVAIGLTAFSMNSTSGAETLVFGGFLGITIGIVASMFAAGWLAGYLGKQHCSKRHLGALYGFLTWCVALILLIFLASHAQNYISFYSHFLSGTTMSSVAINNPTTATTVVMNATPNQLVMSSFILFCLFFLSAFASSLGGHCGMRHVCKQDRA